MRDEGLNNVQRYRALFLQEAREYLQLISTQLLQLMRGPTDEVYYELFRLSHSIKGMAATLGFSDVKQVSHAMEDVFDRMKRHRIQVDESILSVMFGAVDLLEIMVSEIDALGSTSKDISSVLSALTEILNRESQPASQPERRQDLELIVPEPPAPAIPDAQQLPETRFLYRIDITIASEASFPAARAIVAYKRMEELGKISKCIPAFEEITGPNFHKHLSCYLVTSQTAVDLQSELRGLSDVDAITVTPIDPHSRQSPAAAAETISTNTVEESRPVEMQKLATVRIDTRSLDGIVEGLGELLILNAQVQDSLPEVPEVVRLHSLTQKLYDRALDLRMLPFETLSSRFPRVIHDLSRQLHKAVELKVEGSEIKLDKSVLDELADPLVHLLRNAVDHGIEPAAFRISKGKPETGTIRMKVEKDGDRVRVTVEDDGKGLDPVLIRAAAIRKGIITEKAASFLNQHETLMLICRPGFSTANEVSDISGRGVGMDVVRDRIDELGGSFKIYTTPGKFTRFELLIPFTVAIIPALLVRAGGLQFAIPSSRVDRFLMIRKSDVHYTQGKPVVFYENSTIYVEHLESILNHRVPGGFEEEFPVFVTEHQNRRIAWNVDELLEQKQIMLKPLGEPLSSLSCYSGATVLGRGEVIPVLDMEQLYRERYQ